MHFQKTPGKFKFIPGSNWGLLSHNSNKADTEKGKPFVRMGPLVAQARGRSSALNTRGGSGKAAGPDNLAIWNQGSGQPGYRKIIQSGNYSKPISGIYQFWKWVFLFLRQTRRRGVEMKKRLVSPNIRTKKFMPRFLHELIDFLLKYTVVSYSD